jgi:hypothetical protein
LVQTAATISQISLTRPADTTAAAITSLQVLLSLDPHGDRVQPDPDLLYFTPAGFSAAVSKALMTYCLPDQQQHWCGPGLPVWYVWWHLGLAAYQTDQQLQQQQQDSTLPGTTAKPDTQSSKQHQQQQQQQPEAASEVQNSLRGHPGGGPYEASYEPNKHHNPSCGQQLGMSVRQQVQHEQLQRSSSCGFPSGSSNSTPSSNEAVPPSAGRRHQHPYYAASTSIDRPHPLPAAPESRQSPAAAAVSGWTAAAPAGVGNHPCDPSFLSKLYHDADAR